MCADFQWIDLVCSFILLVSFCVISGFLCICAQIDILNGRWNCQMNQNEKGEDMLNWRGDFKGDVFFFPVTQRRMSLIIPTSKEFSLI